MLSGSQVLTLGGSSIARGTITADAHGTNTSFGDVQFVLQIATDGVVTGSTVYQGNGNANSAADNTTGVGTVTFVSTDVTPEPSSFVLLGTGLLGLGGLIKRRIT
ncbi:MAG: PEP-CTERM sorting domain-containing protein [Edaphobacter sp.]